ncbi:hypothetical protein Hanom_Chr17g01559991 [Helianthus anomalus]
MKVEKSAGIKILGDLEDDKEGFSDRKGRWDIYWRRICINGRHMILVSRYNSTVEYEIFRLKLIFVGSQLSGGFSQIHLNRFVQFLDPSAA